MFKITNQIVKFKKINRINKIKIVIDLSIITEFASKYTISIYSQCQTILDFNNGCVLFGLDFGLNLSIYQGLLIGILIFNS